MDDSSLSIVIAGAAGQGVQTVEKLLVEMTKRHGLHVYAMKEYMSRIRGGSNSTEIRIAAHPVAAPVQRIDVAIVLDKDAYGHLEWRIGNATLIFGDEAFLEGATTGQIHPLALTATAKALGNAMFANSIAVGFIAALIDISPACAQQCVAARFAGKDKAILDGNTQAIDCGYALAGEITKEKKIALATDILKPDTAVNNEDMLCNGTEAIGLGAINGGCNFISSYPMSPGTGVLVYLSQHAHQFNIIAEQAEDEISAINMAIGASYAGARAMVTTSGGGFALMSEGISLAGIMELPVVTHIAQRPGPATGLPTRTEQGDLELVLYAGHGDFPRAVFAPRSVADAFALTVKAFDVADEYQIPVFILSDQYLVDSYYNMKPFVVKRTMIENHIVKTGAHYKRFAITENGISPRGIPGYGDGLVRADSDEHTESGLITESHTVRKQMVLKRLDKYETVRDVVMPPILVGADDYEILVIGWGSTYEIIAEALSVIDNKKTALLHFNQVYPLHKGTEQYLIKAKKCIIVENNVTAQFARLIRRETGISISEKILKYDGLPFFVDELVEELKQKL